MFLENLLFSENTDFTLSKSLIKSTNEVVMAFSFLKTFVLETIDEIFFLLGGPKIGDKGNANVIDLLSFEGVWQSFQETL